MTVTILIGDVRDKLAELPDESVHCVVTSPPYFGLRDYGVAGQIGLEATPDEFIAAMVEVFREVRRVLRADGTLWLNLGDSYAGSWGAQSRGGPPSASSTLKGNGHIGGGPKIKGLSAVQIAAHPHHQSPTGTIRQPGLKPKDLMMMPARVALALQADGWWLRSDIIWHKPNPMPESITDRPTTSHEHIFLLAKSERYFYDADAVRETRTAEDKPGGSGSGFHVDRVPVSKKKIKVPGGWDTKPGAHGTINRQGRTSAEYRDIGKQAQSARTMDRERAHRVDGLNERWDEAEAAGGLKAGRNIRNVWTVATSPYSEAHFATFPPALIEPCIKAGCPAGGTVLDPFFGAGTTGLVADRLGRNCIGIELNPQYAAMAQRRIEGDAGMFSKVTAA